MTGQDKKQQITSNKISIHAPRVRSDSRSLLLKRSDLQEPKSFRKKELDPNHNNTAARKNQDNHYYSLVVR